MRPFFDEFYANPSAYHKCGREVCDAIEQARYDVAEYLICAPNEIIFTSGATEANNLALKSCAFICGESCKAGKYENKFNFIISEIEHKSVLNIKEWLQCQGYEVRIARNTPDGIIDLEYLADLFDDNTVLCSCMYINNETGVIQPVEEISEFCKENGVVFHIDATQAFGKYQIGPLKSNDRLADLITASGHKFHGPKGIGILYKSNDVKFKCLVDGGSQEDGRRPGTENVPGIIGFAEATKIAKRDMTKHLTIMMSLEKFLFNELDNRKIEYTVNGSVDYKSPWITNISFGIDANDLMELLPNYCFSKSSACSKDYRPSHVLQAMSIDDDITKTSVRISFSKYTTQAEIKDFVYRISKIQKEHFKQEELKLEEEENNKWNIPTENDLQNETEEGEFEDELY